MNSEEYVGWLFAVDHTVSELIDCQGGTIEDEEFLLLWWNEIRKGWELAHGTPKELLW